MLKTVNAQKRTGSAMRDLLDMEMGSVNLRMGSQYQRIRQRIVRDIMRLHRGIGRWLGIHALVVLIMSPCR
jgi:hypothetical protein